ncbi:hypothetical protein KIL84_003492 [Mauremys mutica]|uniref:Uncharacterized protein n=1 Tax=Mauremys mutica TaxID=74926 RepID=A0A9D3WPJ3_9SAUR|nr:hypothetical protein KIL84_003492 [Mauremys mutica]
MATVIRAVSMVTAWRGVAGLVLRRGRGLFWASPLPCSKPRGTRSFGVRAAAMAPVKVRPGGAVSGTRRGPQPSNLPRP